MCDVIVILSPVNARGHHLNYKELHVMSIPWGHPQILLTSLSDKSLTSDFSNWSF